MERIMTNKIARALFIGERLLSEHSAYAGLTELSKPYCYVANFTVWLESPDGLKAVRDAISRSAGWSMETVSDYTIFNIWRGNRETISESGGESEAEAILTATEAFLNDQVD